MSTIKHPSEEALVMLGLLAEGYGVPEAAALAFPGYADATDHWRNIRKATWAALGAVSTIQAYAVARDRGLLRPVRV